MIEVEGRRTSESTSSRTDDVSVNTTDKSPTSDAENTVESRPTESHDDDDDDDTQDDVTGQLRPLRLELTPESQLDSIEPIYVDLLDCTTSVKEVLKWLTSASWCVCVCLSVCLLLLLLTTETSETGTKSKFFENAKTCLYDF